jgi:4-hydroxybenzoate polyprenyltransferase
MSIPGSRRPTRASRIAERLRQYGLLMRLDKPIGTLLLLWPTLWALWIAGSGRPDQDVFVVFVLGVFLLRSAGCVINDVADRKFDPHVARTRQRPLASGKVGTTEALLLFLSLMLMAFWLVLHMNRLTIYMAVAGAALACIYPFTKRVTHLPQLVLGAAFGWGVPMAFAAQTGHVPQLAWLMFLVVLVWATIYDTMYAMVDREDDLSIGLKSTAILFGDTDIYVIGILQVALVAGLVMMGTMAGLGTFYWLGVAAAAGACVHQWRLIQRRNPDRCFQAFLNNNLLGAWVFSGILLHYTFTAPITG